MTIGLKRAYEQPSANDGYRVLVDGIWPRGVRKDALRLDAWRKEVAPSRELRKWFNHDACKWHEFTQCYFKELDNNPRAVEELAGKARDGRLTLVFAAKDPEHNNAVALKEYLENGLDRC